MENATFGAGCFWGVEASFSKVTGVTSTAVGYAGGALANATYKDVCLGTTGHAEVVRVDFDPVQVTYEELLDLFWQIHDPTTLNRQGPDIGTQYRSAIHTHGPAQQAAALASLDNAADGFSGPIVTEITPAPDFWMAEEYHQQYFNKRAYAHGA